MAGNEPTRRAASDCSDPDGSTEDGEEPAWLPSRRSFLAGLGATAGAGYLTGLSSAAPTGESEGTLDAPIFDVTTTDGATALATSSGSWNDSSVWESGSVPGDGARVLIEPGVTVTLAREAAARLKWVRVDGTLEFDPTTDTHLRVETLVSAPDGTIRIGTQSNPVAPNVQAQVTFVDDGPIDESVDPNRVSRGLIGVGRTEIYGAEKTPWTTMSGHPTSGDTQLTLDETPTNWQPGDELVVVGVEPPVVEGNDDGSMRDPQTMITEDEERTIQSVSGSTVRLDSPLDHDHVPPRSHLEAYVMNLTRNVRLQSENDDIPRRGHTMYMSRETDVHNAGHYDLGRTDKAREFTDPAPRFEGNVSVPEWADGPNPKARYALHFHRFGVMTEQRPARVSGCAVHGSPGWGYVNHHSYVNFTENVSYDVFGAHFVAEGGNEMGSFERNLAVRSKGSGRGADFRDNAHGSVEDFGHSGHGFWFQGPAVVARDNVAAGHRHDAFNLWCRAIIDRDLGPGAEPGDEGTTAGGIPNFPVENVERVQRGPGTIEETHGSDGLVPSSFVKIREFSGNTGFASPVGLDFNRSQFTNQHDRTEAYSEIEGFTAYNTADFWGNWSPHGPNFGSPGGNMGIMVRYVNNVEITGAELYGPRSNSADSSTSSPPESIGLGNNALTINNVYEDCTIEGWELGAILGHRGIATFENMQLSNTRNALVRGGGTDLPGYERDDRAGSPHTVEMADLTLEDGSASNLEMRLWIGSGENRSAHGLFDPTGGITLDGNEVYFDEQAADHVPLPDQGTLDPMRDQGVLNQYLLPDGVTATDLVGLTNQEMMDQYGVAVEGAIVPDSAGRDPAIDGGYVDGSSGGGNQSPSASISASPSTAATGEAITFDGSGSSDADGSIGVYDWDFGDGTSASGQSVQHSYADAGSYTVTLTVTDDGGATASATASATVEAEAPENEGPTASISVSPSPATAGEAVTFDASGSSDADGSISSYDWSFGDGTSASGESVQHTYEGAGTYDATLTVTDDDGATGTATASVTVEERATATVAVGSSSVRVDETTTVPVSLSAVPNGLSGFRVTVSVADASVASIASGGTSVDGTFGLTTVNVAADGSSVVLEGVDNDDTVASGAGSVGLATVQLQGVEAGETALSVSVQQVDDDGGSSVPASTSGGTLTVQDGLGVPAVGDSANPPTDPDGDGLAEDVNGNGGTDFDDVVTLFENMEGDAVQGNAEVFDFNGNDQLDFQDIVELFEEL